MIACPLIYVKPAADDQMIEFVRVRVVGLIDMLDLSDWRRVRGCGWIVVLPLSETGFVTYDL